MWRICVRRIFETVPVLLAVATVTFLLAKVVPGGPFDDEKPLPADVKAALNAHYGLNKPIFVQYGHYLKNVVQGQLGPSYKNEGFTVSELLAERIPVSLTLGFMAILVAVVAGITVGTFAALKQNTVVDYILTSTAMVGICLPSFVLGPLIILLFSLKLGWFSAGGLCESCDYVLPVLTLAMLYTGYIARLFRASMLEVIRQDYMRTALAKGLPTWRILLVHGMKNALAPVVNFLGPTCASVFSGSLIIETVFNIHGVGRLFLQAINDRDDPVILGAVLFYAATVIVFNFITEIILTWMHPQKA